MKSSGPGVPLRKMEVFYLNSISYPILQFTGIPIKQSNGRFFLSKLQLPIAFMFTSMLNVLSFCKRSPQAQSCFVLLLFFLDVVVVLFCLLVVVFSTYASIRRQSSTSIFNAFSASTKHR